jgi:hypothetical protein
VARFAAERLAGGQSAVLESKEFKTKIVNAIGEFLWWNEQFIHALRNSFFIWLPSMMRQGRAGRQCKIDNQGISPKPWRQDQTLLEGVKRYYSGERGRLDRFRRRPADGIFSSI